VETGETGFAIPPDRQTSIAEGLEKHPISFLVSCLVAVVVIIVGFSLDRANTAAHLRELTIRTENEISLIRARVNAQINMDITIVRDLSNMVAISTNVDEEEMERQITWLLIQNPHFVHIAVAPDFIVRSVFPPTEANSASATTSANS
jgi:sensor domain CHASE-containing protein